MSDASSNRPDLLHSTLNAYHSITRASTTVLSESVNCCDTISCGACASSKRCVIKFCPSLASKRSVPTYGDDIDNDDIAQPRKLEDCPQEFDSTLREAKLALRATDLTSWATSSRPNSSVYARRRTNLDPVPIQHWALIVRFEKGEKTSVYEAMMNENGLLQAFRAAHVNYEVFSEAMYFATVTTSPSVLLENAKRVPSNGTSYNPMSNNCQTWLKEYLNLISPELLGLLNEKTRSYYGMSCIAIIFGVLMIFV